MRFSFVRMIDFKLMASRIRDYFGYVQFPMIAYLFVVQTGFNIVETVAVVAISSCLIAILDWKVIYPAEQGRAIKKNPEWTKMMEKLDYLIRMMDDDDKQDTKLAEDFGLG